MLSLRLYKNVGFLDTQAFYLVMSNFDDAGLILAFQGIGSRLSMLDFSECVRMN